jgi:hypothetical protein
VGCQVRAAEVAELGDCWYLAGLGGHQHRGDDLTLARVGQTEHSDVLDAGMG